MFAVHVYLLKITLLKCWKKQYLQLWQLSRVRLLKFLASKWQFRVINGNDSSRKEKTYSF